MFCGHCGAKNEDGAIFCASCGARLSGMDQTSNVISMPETAQQKKKNTKIGIIFSVVVLLILVLAGGSLINAQSYKKTVKQFYKAAFATDAKKVMKLLPKKMIEEEMKNSDYDSYDDMIDDMQDSLDGATDVIETTYGKKWKGSYKILDVEDIEGSELRDIKEDYEDYDLKIKKAKKVDVKIKIKGDGKENSTTSDVVVIKIGMKWYLDIQNSNYLY